MQTVINQLNALNGGGNVSSTTGNLLSLEGTPVHANAGSGTSMNIGPFTTTKPALIVIVNTNNASGAAGISSITGGGLTWAKRTGSGGSNTIEEWTASAGAALSGVTFTINFNSATMFDTADVFAISGNNTSTIYDANASIPANGAADPLTVSTNNAFDFVFGGFRLANASETPGAGWTQISSAEFQLVEYQIVQVPQTNLSVNMATHVGTASGGIADAVMSA